MKMEKFGGLVSYEYPSEEGIDINYFVYMDNEDETHSNNIIEISKFDFCDIADFNITYNCGDRYAREKEFRLLIEKSEAKCIEVPWCESAEIRGTLLKSYIR